MIGRLRQLSEPRLRKQAGIEKSLTPVERDILVQWVRKLQFYNLTLRDEKSLSKIKKAKKDAEMNKIRNRTKDAILL